LIKSIRRLGWSDAHLADIALPGGVMRLTRSLASGLARCAGDPPGTFWGVGDRGPNIKPDDAADRYGLEHLRPLGAHDGAKIMPLPGAGPALARFRRDGDAISLEAATPLHSASGKPIGGLPVPHGPHAEFEPIYGLDGAALPTGPDGADSEGIAAQADGSFWISEEYGPSLLRVSPDGTVRERWVPEGLTESFAGASYPVRALLPALAAARKLNRGFEAIAVSDDGAVITLAFQSPLAHPDRAAHEASTLLRIWQLDGASGALLAEYAYPLDPPESFRRDADLGEVVNADIKVSELLLLGGGDVLVLERVTKSTKLYRVRLDPAHALPAALSQLETRPTLEQLGAANWATAGVIPLAKTLVFDTDQHPEIPGDLEGMVLLAPDELLLSNDSDFGIEGAETEFWLVKFAQPLA